MDYSCASLPRLVLSTPHRLQTHASHPDIWAVARTCTQLLHQAIQGPEPNDRGQGQLGSTDALWVWGTVSIGP